MLRSFFIQILQINEMPILQIIQLLRMISLFRKIVAGPKNKTFYDGNQLDFTYITDRIIAMAFPASGLIEQTYRNSVTDVSNYLNQNHEHYLIVNVSSREYDHRYFRGKVKDYEWPDHQAPPLTTLIQIACQMKNFLQKYKNSVIAVHCNHGKGRTGTAIISFMLYIGFQREANKGLVFYNQRRFNVNTYGVDQPCQTRYLGFVQKIKKMKYIPQKMIAYKIMKVTQKGLGQQCFLTVHKTRTGQLKHQKIHFGANISATNKTLMIGDVFLQVSQSSWKGQKRLARINYHLFFLNPESLLNIPSMSVKFSSKQLKISKKLGDKQFQITIQFQYYCLCHIAGNEGANCPCDKQRKMQESYWCQMRKQLLEAQKYDGKDGSTSYFYYDAQPQNIEEVELRIEDFHTQKKNHCINYQQNVIGLDGLLVSKDQGLGQQTPFQGKNQLKTVNLASLKAAELQFHSESSSSQQQRP